MTRRKHMKTLLLVGLPLLFPGCVSVNTRVHSNGAVTRQVRIQVERSHEGTIWQVMKKNLTPPQQGWILKKRRQGNSSTILATHLLPDGERSPNPSLRIETAGLVHRRYHYEERLPLSTYATGPSAGAIAAVIPIVLSLRMPGKVVEATGATVSGNVATWNFNLGPEDVVIQASSSQNRYCLAVWTVIVVLLALASVASWVKERLSR